MKNKINYKIFIILLGFALAISILKLSRSGSSKHPNIIFITIDALRADHLGCYGYQRSTSPNIDKLAGEGVIVDKCFATSSATSWSFPGLLTGRYLGIKSKRFEFLDHLLDKKFVTLAEYLKGAGYYTAAFINNLHLEVNKGFEQGIDYFNNLKEEEGSAQTITDRVIDFLEHYQNDQPLFVWIHYIDVHTPYTGLKGYFDKFENDKLYKENDEVLELRPMGADDKNKLTDDRINNGYTPKGVIHAGKYNLNYYIAAYDSKILYTDFYIGKLLNNIKDDTIIILTADHGESLGEHGVYFTHGRNIYDEVLQIPLIIKDKRYCKAGKKITAVGSGVDIVPTILSRINSLWYFFNKNKFNGIDLLAIPDGKNRQRRYIYSYSPNVYSIRDVKEDVKYISASSGREELYFFPNEETNRIKDNSPRVAKIRKGLKANLIKWIKEGYPIQSDIKPRETVLNRKTEEGLKSLGYLQ